MVIRSASQIGAVSAAKAVKPLATAAKPQLAKGARDAGTSVAREAVTSWCALAGLVHIVAALLVGASLLRHCARWAVCALLALVALGPITAGIAIRPSGAGNCGRSTFAACVASGTAVARPLARFILKGPRFALEAARHARIGGHSSRAAGRLLGAALRRVEAHVGRRALGSAREIRGSGMRALLARQRRAGGR